MSGCDVFVTLHHGISASDAGGGDICFGTGRGDPSEACGGTGGDTADGTCVSALPVGRNGVPAANTF